MHSNQDDLAAQFQRLTDEALISRATSGGLTARAQSVAIAEAQARGLCLPGLTPVDETTEAQGSYHGDMKMVARNLTPTEAHILCSCLQAAAVPAEVGDANLVQAHGLLAIALGGASLRVPEQFVPEAMAVIAAFQRGEFSLGEDFDFGA
jgi:hypothetical protein